MTSHGPPPLQGRNTLFLQLCFKYHGPKFLLHPGHGVRSVIAWQIPFFFAFIYLCRQLTKGRDEGRSAPKLFSREDGLGLLPMLVFWNYWNKVKHQVNYETVWNREHRQQLRLMMSYLLLSVHTQILVVCKLNLWRVRRQICTEKQNSN